MSELTYFDSFNKMDFSTKISCDYLDGSDRQILIVITGDMEALHARYFSGSMNALFAAEKNLESVLLDLEYITYISSSCISAFLQLVHQARAKDLELFFINPLPHMQEVIDAMGLGHFIKKIKLPGSKTISLKCKKCNAKITVKGPGRVTCPQCGATVTVSDKGLSK